MDLERGSQGMKLLVGTAKGLVVLSMEQKEWSIKAVHFRGMPVTSVFVDRRTNTWWAGLAHRHWGQKLQFSTDEGDRWFHRTPPVYPKDAKLSSGKSAVLKKIWAIQGAGPDRPGGLWLGTEPGGLFYSDDNGANFHLVDSLWNHPSRGDRNQWFGAGRDHPFIHSIVVDPRDSQHLYIAVSCAGVFESKDGGQSWAPRNRGLIAAYLPNPQVEVGHDPHLLLACHAQPEVLWQQNHCGIFRSTDAGANWVNVTDSTGLASYGFALAIDQNDPLRAWVIPAVSDEERVAPDLALCVCRTEDGGQTWQALRNGLPQNHCFDIVFRHSLTIQNNHLAFGTTTGTIFWSPDYGDHWQEVSHHLARVESITFA